MVFCFSGTGNSRYIAGRIAQATADERIALKKALEKSASAMILVHNHPSSSPIPSKADIEITQKFRNACEACSIDLLDHVIICDDCFFSFADEKTFRP